MHIATTEFEMGLATSREKGLLSVCKIIIFKAHSIILNTRFIILNTKFINLNTEIINFDTNRYLERVIKFLKVD